MSLTIPDVNDLMDIDKGGAITIKKSLSVEELGIVQKHIKDIGKKLYNEECEKLKKELTSRMIWGAKSIRVDDKFIKNEVINGLIQKGYKFTRLVKDLRSNNGCTKQTIRVVEIRMFTDFSEYIEYMRTPNISYEKKLFGYKKFQVWPQPIERANFI